MKKLFFLSVFVVQVKAGLGRFFKRHFLVPMKEETIGAKMRTILTFLYVYFYGK
jgi:hypothetical protein